MRSKKSLLLLIYCKKIRVEEVFIHKAKYPLNGRATILTTAEVYKTNFKDLKTIAKQWEYKFTRQWISNLVHFEKKTSNC